MVCIYCGTNTRVQNSRLQRRANQVWRRRTCLSCQSTFTTHERPDLAAALVVRYDAKAIRPFSRDQLYISLYESCKHRAQAISDAEGLSQTVIGLLLRERIKHGSITRQDIVTTVSQVLSRFDQTAATVYSAFHKV